MGPDFFKNRCIIWILGLRCMDSKFGFWMSCGIIAYCRIKKRTQSFKTLWDYTAIHCRFNVIDSQVSLLSFCIFFLTSNHRYDKSIFRKLNISITWALWFWYCIKKSFIPDFLPNLVTTTTNLAGGKLLRHVKPVEKEIVSHLHKSTGKFCSLELPTTGGCATLFYYLSWSMV